MRAVSLGERDHFASSAWVEVNVMRSGCNARSQKKEEKQACRVSLHPSVSLTKTRQAAKVGISQRA